MKRWLSVLLILLLAMPVSAGWDKTKPATSSPLVSSEIRDNWTALETALKGVNLLADSTFIIWAAGDSAAPTHYAVAGTGNAIARAGTGLGDTSRKVGKFTAKMTSGSATMTIEQNILTTTSYDDGFDGRAATGCAWIRASNATTARVYIADGAGTTFSSYHTGGGSYEWLCATRTIDAAATKLTWGSECAATSRVCYVSGATAVLGNVPPDNWIPSATIVNEWVVNVAGTLTTGTNKARFEVWRPGIVLDVHLVVNTQPTGQAIIVDVNTFDGAANTSMFSTRPQIAASTSRGSAQPDTTYARRCFSFGSGATFPAGAWLTLDIDQVGSGTAGADLFAFIRYVSFARPLEGFLAYNEIN